VQSQTLSIASYLRIQQAILTDCSKLEQIIYAAKHVSQNRNSF